MSWLRIQCTRDRNTRQCYEGLLETCSEHAFLYRTVSRWVRAFKEGRQNVTDMSWPGHPSVKVEDVQTMNTLVLGLGSALPPSLLSRFKPLQLRSRP